MDELESFRWFLLNHSGISSKTHVQKRGLGGHGIAGYTLGGGEPSQFTKIGKNADTYKKLKFLMILGSKSCYKHIFHRLDVKSEGYGDEIGKNVTENQWRPHRKKLGD